MTPIPRTRGVLRYGNGKRGHHRSRPRSGTGYDRFPSSGSGVETRLSSEISEPPLALAARQKWLFSGRGKGRGVSAGWSITLVESARERGNPRHFVPSSGEGFQIPLPQASTLLQHVCTPQQLEGEETEGETTDEIDEAEEQRRDETPPPGNQTRYQD